MKSKRPKSGGPPAVPTGPTRQPSLIDVRDSWIEVTDRRSEHPSLLETLPTLRPPAITLPDDALILDDVEGSFPEYEAPTIPHIRSARPPLGSLDEAALIKELSAPPVGSPAAHGKKDKAPSARRSTRPPRRSTTSPPARNVEDLDLSLIPAFEDLSPEIQYLLLAAAAEHQFTTTTTVLSLETALIVQGAVRVGVARVQGEGGTWSGLTLAAGEVITRRRSLYGEGDPVLLGAEPRAVLLTWQSDAIDQVVGMCPWLEDTLRDEGDRVQTLLLLARTQRRTVWREVMRLSRLTRLGIRVLEPGVSLVAAGTRERSMAIVGYGKIELMDGNRIAGTLKTGDIVFPSGVLTGAPAPMTARASETGATVLVADVDVVRAALTEMPTLARMLRSTS